MRRPLRAPPDTSTRWLELVAGRSVLNAMWFVAGRSPDTLTRAVESLMAVARAVRPPRPVDLFAVTDAGRAESVGPLAFSDAEGDRVASLLAKGLGVRLADVLPSFPPPWSGTLLAYAGSVEIDAGAPVTGVAISVGVPEADARAPEIVATLSGAVDAAMDRHAGLQGATYGSGEPDAWDLEATVYERACELHGPPLLARSWLERWLRRPGNLATWLGPTLAARVPAALRQRVRAYANVEGAEAGWLRIVAPATDSSRLEDDLAELLPSEADLDAALQARRKPPRVRCDACGAEAPIVLPRDGILAFPLPGGWFELHHPSGGFPRHACSAECLARLRGE